MKREGGGERDQDVIESGERGGEADYQSFSLGTDSPKTHDPICSQFRDSSRWQTDLDKVGLGEGDRTEAQGVLLAAREEAHHGRRHNRGPSLGGKLQHRGVGLERGRLPSSSSGDWLIDGRQVMR